jgi:hypothetical protein
MIAQPLEILPLGSKEGLTQIFPHRRAGEALGEVRNQSQYSDESSSRGSMRKDSEGCSLCFPHDPRSHIRRLKDISRKMREGCSAMKDISDAYIAGSLMANSK